MATPMMKIQVTELEDRVILEVSGRIAGSFVPVLQSSWSAAIAGGADRCVVIDLKHVTCVDRAGRALLRSMHRSGAAFLRAGIATQDILDQIAQEQECGHQA